MKSRTITHSLLAIIFLGITQQSMAQPERFLAGHDYTLIESPIPDRTPDVVEVTEYFWYGCPGCFAFEPEFANWIEQQDDDVLCQRLPALWDDWREVHARAYYTASSLGILDKMHSILFNAMHIQGNRLRNVEEVGQLFADHGVARVAFDKAYHSFTVNSEIRRANNMAIQAGARSTPSLIVNGKYLVMLSRDTLDIVDFLVQKELKKG